MEYLLIHVSANWDLKTLGELAGFWRVPFPINGHGGPPCHIGWSSASQTTTVSPQGNGKSCGAVAVQHDKYDEYGRPNYGETFLSWCGIPASANRDFFLLTCKKPWFCHSCLKGILCFPYTYSWHEILQQTLHMKQCCECSFEQDLIFICSFSAKIPDSNTTLSPLQVPSLHGSMGATRSYGISRKITKDSEGVAALEEISACNPLPGGVVYGCLWDLGRSGRFFGGEGFWDGKGGMEIAEGIYILTPNITAGPGGFEVLCPKYHSERFNLKIDWKRKMLYVFDVATLHFLGFMWAMWLDSWW